MAPRSQKSVPAGNTFNKYASGNPIARRLVQGFLKSHRELLSRISANRVLDVGCGEGFLLAQIQDDLPEARVTALDLDPATVAESRDCCPSAGVLVADAEQLPFPTGSFDLVVACEVLEHLPHPHQAVAEFRRVLADDGVLLASVPWEPVWRMLNVARGAYLSDWGNTPGHLNHFSRRDFLQLVEQSGFRVREIRRPFPWTFLLAGAETGENRS